jgi:hypothetical protein
MWPRIACSLSKSGITKRPDSAPAVSWGPRGNEVPDRREHERLGLKKWQSLDVRDELERAVSLESDDGKIPSVSREDSADVLPLREVGQSGIGKLQASGFKTRSTTTEAFHMLGIAAEVSRQALGRANQAKPLGKVTAIGL